MTGSSSGRSSGRASRSSSDPSSDLTAYRRKRSFEKTPEPSGESGGHSDGSLRFVIQEHHARRLHFDFRLERDGVLVSWALPKGLPTDPHRNHLAVHVEDHPLDYGSFAGRIPEGQYGAGTVAIWDHGTYETEKWELGGRRGEVMVRLHGERAEGRYVLFQTDGKNWMIHRMDAASGNLPEHVKPMLAKASPHLPQAPDDDWAYEFKWDGIRALAACTPGEVRLYTRTDHEITERYPELRRLMDAVGGRSLLLDGEIVAFDDKGVPRFERLQQRIGLSREADVRQAMKEVPAVYLIFDVLHLDGRDTMRLPYLERRRVLEELDLNGRSWHTPPYQVGHGDDLFKAASKQGLEGVMAKRASSRYEPGARSGAWLKVKVRHGQELVIGGWQLGQGRREGYLGSLLVGYYDGDDLRYAGRVGTGYTEATLRQLRDALAPLARDSSPFGFSRHLPRKDVRFVEPKLVAEFQFAEWTDEGQLRAPAFKGLRDDKDPRQVVREESAP